MTPTRPTSDEASSDDAEPGESEPSPERRSMAPLTIGLTGGIAAGKSEALAAFARLGAATLSSDAVVHELLDSEPLLRPAGRALGSEEVAPDGTVDRGRDRRDRLRRPRAS